MRNTPVLKTGVVCPIIFINRMPISLQAQQQNQPEAIAYGWFLFFIRQTFFICPLTGYTMLYFMTHKEDFS
ncbi:MAG TPA: hypothetical protein DEO95_06205 [Ruminococcaceae bacterium]|nr:hypothetical protein [Oscillospiraceae bacterium]